MNPAKRSRYADRICIFLIGFLLCLCVGFHLQDNFERNFFKRVADNILLRKHIVNEDSGIVDALHVTYQLLSVRSFVFKDQRGIADNIYGESLTGDLMMANGACGSYAAVLANLLQTMGYITRIAQMKVNGLYGGHIIIEVKTMKGWVVLDALYDLYFTTPSGKLASFADVSENWGYYKRQTPDGYNKDYRYEGARYANWDKIPVIMPLLKKGLVLLVGTERAETFSIRPFFLRKYRVYSLLLIPLILLLVCRFVKNQYLRGYSKSKKSNYLSFANEVSLKPLLNCLDSHALNAQKTAANISVLNIPFNSLFSILKRKLGLPKYSIRTHYGNTFHDVYFYTIDLYNKRTIVQFHYFDEKFFLCNIIFTNR